MKWNIFQNLIFWSFFFGLLDIPLNVLWKKWNPLLIVFSPPPFYRFLEQMNILLFLGMVTILSTHTVPCLAEFCDGSHPCEDTDTVCDHDYNSCQWCDMDSLQCKPGMWKDEEKSEIFKFKGPPPSLGSDVTLHLVGDLINFLCRTMHIGHRCRTITEIMVPFNFWQNYEPF